MEPENNKLIRRALRWQTESDAETWDGKDIQKVKAKEIALLVTRRNMMSSDGAISNAAVRNLISMEAQNQKDDQEPQGDQHLHLHGSAAESYDDVPEDVVIDARLAWERLEASRNGKGGTNGRG